jgi:tetratricopeptide (TPR) repeat protein
LLLALLGLLIPASATLVRAAIQSDVPGFRVDVGDVREVEQRIRQEIERTGNDPLLLHELGTVLYRQGRIEQARKLWDEAAAKEPELAVADVEIVFEQLQAGKMDAATAALERARKNRPNDPHLYLAVGQLAVAMRDKDSAGAAYDQAQQIAPGLAVVNISRGRFLQLIGDSEGARRDFQSAVEAAPKQPIGWHMLAIDDFRNDRIQECLENLKKAEASRPGQPVAESRLAEFYLQAGDYPDAYLWYVRALERAPDDQLIKCRAGQMLTILKQPDRAREIFRSLIEPDGFVSALVALAQLEEAEGNWAEAAQLYERVLKQDENNVVANNNLAMLLVQLGQTPERALKLVERAQRLDGTKPEILSTYGCALVHASRHDEAAEVLRSSVRSEPNESWLRYCYGVALTHMGKHAEAAKQFEACLLLDPEFPRKTEIERLVQRE